MSTEIRALEFFSGIGGFHYALLESDISGTVVKAWDMNINANNVYTHNFHNAPSSTAIEYLTSAIIDKYDANTWFMSPPCQPFTRGGKLLDDIDPRSKALLHLINLLPTLSTPPQFIVLENVLNFEKSQCRTRLVSTLEKLQYTISECLITPTQLGIPNARLRYYLIARRSEFIQSDLDKECLEKYISTSVIQTQWPIQFPYTDSGKCTSQQTTCTNLKQYLNLNDKEIDHSYLVPEEWMCKRPTFRFDVVAPWSLSSSTFTSGYGSHHIFGSGSFLATECSEYTHEPPYDIETTLRLHPRLFTPDEVARLHCFPLTATSVQPIFTWPEGLSRIQKWKLIGNSLNVYVVAGLIRTVFTAM